MSSGPTVSSGRRGYLRYRYGTHYWVPEVQAGWTRGMITDTTYGSQPAGSLLNSIDFLLYRPGLMQKRGGTSYAGPAMTAATYATGVVYAPYAAGGQLLGVGDNGHLYTVASGTTTDVSTLGATFASRHRPVITTSSAAILAVLFSNDGTTAPKKWDGAAAANLGGTPPTGLLGGIYKQRLLIANSNANPNRLWFSETPNVESTWDTANKYLDTEGAITGLAALNNVLLIFHQGFTERVIGSVPPGTVGTDMDKGRMWDIGCQDSRSIWVQDGTVLFANSRGVYMSNGSTPVSLTERGGIASYWQQLFYNYDPTTWTISVGTFQQFAIVSVIDASGVFIDTLMCYLPTRAWWRLSNIKASMFANGRDTSDELYYADRASNRVLKCREIVYPVTTAASRADANGTVIGPTATLLFGAGPGVSDFGHGHVDYSMNYSSGAGSMTVTLGAEYQILFSASIPGLPVQASPFTPAESPLISASSGHPERKRFVVGRSGQALTVTLTQTAVTNSTEIYAVEIEGRSMPLTGEGIS